MTKKRELAAALCAALLFTRGAQAAVTLEAPAEAKIGQPFVVNLRVVDEKLSDVKILWQKKEARLAPDDSGSYCALIGTDFKNAKAGAAPLAVSFRSDAKEGRTERIDHTIKLTSYKYPSENISVEPSKVNPPKELAERIAREAKLGRAALQSQSGGRAPALPLVRPVPGLFTSVYGKSRYFNGQFRGRHGGVDMRAKEGTPVKAAADGAVTLAANFWFAGNCVYLDHGAGFVTFYCHMSQLKVKTGDRIKAGDAIGLSGQTGRVTGPHLHFSTIWQGEFFDPAAIMEK